MYCLKFWSFFYNEYDNLDIGLILLTFFSTAYVRGPSSPGNLDKNKQRV